MLKYGIATIYHYLVLLKFVIQNTALVAASRYHGRYMYPFRSGEMSIGLQLLLFSGKTIVDTMPECVIPNLQNRLTDWRCFFFLLKACFYTRLLRSSSRFGTHVRAHWDK